MHISPATALPDPRICDLARKSRDARFDGLFFTAVSSTGIYCRPVCPAPPARRSNVRYYANAAAAEADGFRPCLRCRPELSPGNEFWQHGDDVVASALKLIADGALAEQSLEQLATRVGIGGRQLRRLFVQRVGVPPHSVYTTQRLLFAKQLLTETALPVTEVALASGFRSLRRFNAAFAQANRIEPRQLRRTPRAAPDAPLVLRLAYRPPYAFDAVLGFLRTRALPGVERVDAHSYARVFGPADAPGWLILDAWPDRSHSLRLQVHCPNAAELLGVVTRLRRMFDLDANPALINETFARDPLLGPLCKRHPGLRVPGSWDGFETAVRAVLGQQVSVAAARTLAARIVQRYGTPLATPPQPGLERLFPTPDVLAAADLAGLGVTTARARTIQGIAQALLDGRVTFDQAQSLDEFVQRWTALPGIGAWTAHYIAMRVQNEPDAFPAADLILRRAAAGGGKPLGERALLERAAAWQPWRAYAVMQLWRASGELAKIPPTTRARRSQ
ncbi:MAG TPA: AlkA N-terminal domain-containing protein [Rhodanobacter sp.]|jgi:AraC family transcriptional regulator of adaptative response / DNA-3-methyladenine glycosylase II|nr:AlkA N-terminal domain-containing protein [Rhodanobacter sp.]